MAGTKSNKSILDRSALRPSSKQSDKDDNSSTSSKDSQASARRKARSSIGFSKSSTRESIRFSVPSHLIPPLEDRRRSVASQRRNASQSNDKRSSQEADEEGIDEVELKGIIIKMVDDIKGKMVGWNNLGIRPKQILYSQISTEMANLDMWRVYVNEMSEVVGKDVRDALTGLDDEVDALKKHLGYK